MPNRIALSTQCLTITLSQQLVWLTWSELDPTRHIIPAKAFLTITLMRTVIHTPRRFLNYAEKSEH
jgi:energy-converting hydrogenase Eha subunit E